MPAFRIKSRLVREGVRFPNIKLKTSDNKFGKTYLPIVKRLKSRSPPETKNITSNLKDKPTTYIKRDKANGKTQVPWNGVLGGLGMMGEVLNLLNTQNKKFNM